MRQTAGAWAWREQAGTRQRDATGSAEWLLFWDRLGEDVINLNAGQGWVAPFGDLQLGAPSPQRALGSSSPRMLPSQVRCVRTLSLCHGLRCASAVWE